MLQTTWRTATVALLATGVATLTAAPAAPDPGDGVLVDAPGQGHVPDGFLSPDDVLTLAAQHASVHDGTVLTTVR